MTTDVYLRRIMHTLEHVIAPEVDDDFARGQVFAVMNLLDNLGKRIEYKRDLIVQEVDAGRELITAVIKELADAGVKTPPEVAEFLSGEPKYDIHYAGKVDESMSTVVELLFASRDALGEERAAALDAMVRDHITKIATRDIGMMAAPNFDKISRSEKKNK